MGEAMPLGEVIHAALLDADIPAGGVEPHLRRSQALIRLVKPQQGKIGWTHETKPRSVSVRALARRNIRQS
jgi:hypothetical protein